MVDYCKLFLMSNANFSEQYTSVILNILEIYIKL